MFTTIMTEALQYVIVSMLFRRMESSPARTALSIVSEANEKFCFDLYKALCKTTGSFLYSPYGVEVALSLVYLGAKERTAKEVADTLHLPPDKKTILDGLSDLLQSIKCTDGSMLHTASKMYIHNKFTIMESFLADAVRLLAEAELVDFENEPDKARTIANEWVQKKTDNKIKNFIADGALDPMTRLVLINAVYFKGKWEHPFSKHSTFPMPFYMSSSQSKEVSMMQQEREFMYANLPELEAQILELPYQLLPYSLFPHWIYIQEDSDSSVLLAVLVQVFFGFPKLIKGNQLSMLVILPNQIDGINELENKIMKVNLHQISDKLYPMKVNVLLPKFNIEKEMQLDEILKQLGMKEIFDEKLANLSGIIGSSLLCVSQIFHKAFIEVSEEGTEAAAASGVMCRQKRSLQEVISFTADHPYLFFVLHKDSNTVLFCGRFS
ncbi:leukocyte elastase inhibitor-like isoform X1 [Schistocerca piceifrons]|uniref:leukocyte elastase inhibitor-like isoform X1 n=1 Tax=Schistocerca piceifrons TaxID=274613 RepID=UPI001F5ECAAA|nr:leukocyte elastase inhibitor-like isoform X1 [Schistocerca piceifrons]